MKSKITTNKTYNAVLRLEIDVVGNFEMLGIMDKNSTDFQEFEMSILLILDQYGFEPKEVDQRDVPGSQSTYYTFAKVENNVDLTVVLVLRISDPSLSDTSGNQKFIEYTKSEAKKTADGYTQQLGYKIRPVMIIFDDNNYSSYASAYELALNDIQDKVEEFDDKCRKEM